MQKRLIHQFEKARRVCLAIARLKPEAKVGGIETLPLLFLIAKWRQFTHHQKNLFHVDIPQADVKYVFGMMGLALKKLHQKLQSNKNNLPGKSMIILLKNIRVRKLFLRRYLLLSLLCKKQFNRE